MMNRWCWVALAVVAGIGQAAERFVVAEEGKARCVIVSADDALAGELQKWLRDVTGATIPIGEGQESPRIVLRENPHPDLGPEGYRLRSSRDELLVEGGSPLGLQHGVYALLEHVGCRWYFPHEVWTIVPKEPSLAVTVDMRSRPAFDYRRIWYGWGHYTKKLREDYDAWTRHNRQLGSFVTDCGHAHDRYVPRREFETHPEWFGLVEGKRQPKQLCMTNPEVERRMIEGVLAVFRKDPTRNMASVDPNDGDGYCECDRCKAVGSVSDNAFRLANAVAKAVRKEFPDKWVGLYAYAFHAEPPKFPFEPGVYVQVTTGFRYTKMSFEEQVSEFRRLGAKLGVYDYFSVYVWDYDLPSRAKAGRVHELAEGIRRYRELGLSTYDAESACNWGPNGLGYWVGAKLMWDPSLDASTLVDDFCTRAFGAARVPMKRMYERWATGQRFSRRGLKLALDDLRDAYGLAQQPEVKARLDHVAMYLHVLRLWLDYERTTRGGERDEIIQRARECIVFARRLMDTGLIHAYPMLLTSRFEHRFGALKRLKDFDLKQTDPWKKERTDIPQADEVKRLFEGDLEAVRGLEAVELGDREYSNDLVPLGEALPGAVDAWGDVKRSPMCVESGLHVFPAKKGEVLEVTMTPYGKGHQVKGRWVLRRLGEAEPVGEGDVEAPKEQSATVKLSIPSDGLYALDPGTGFWKTAQVDVPDRPVSVRAARGKPEFRLWLPKLGQPLYFLVPKGTKSFVLGIPSVGQARSTVRLRLGDGTTILEDKDVRAGDELSVAVPAGSDGAVWSLEMASLRCVVELYGVPPYVARHPSELLVPQETLP